MCSTDTVYWFVLLVKLDRVTLKILLVSNVPCLDHTMLGEGIPEAVQTKDIPSPLVVLVSGDSMGMRTPTIE